MKMIVRAVLAFVLLCPAQANEQSDHFESHVRPLLVKNCHSCHTEEQSGGLRLDSRFAILGGGKSGPAIVPGKPEESLLIAAVRHTHSRLRMPLGGKLSDDEITTLEKWVRDGAFWPETHEEFFISRVRPVIERSCLGCHQDEPAGGLRLDSREALLEGGLSGPAVIPGEPNESLLIQTVRYTHDESRMPPTGQLPAAELADLERWVRDGLAWSNISVSSMPDFVITEKQRNHWSFRPLEVDARRPVVRAEDWPQMAIDNYVLAKLEAKGLEPAPAADRRTLIRRVSYDLTGMAPKPDEVEAFVHDPSPRAFRKVVDRLLASPRYGERWGRHWLDVVRYADSAGDSSDYPIPQMYLYRDYVIEAFNRNLPYDQFIWEQIAGDLLPFESEDQRWKRIIATGYLALSRRFGVTPENDMHLTIEDTVNNLGKTFLGLTTGCARCHNHKYDPISSKDYYGLYGIFASTRYPFGGSENINEQKDLVYRLPEEDIEAVLAPIRSELDPIEEELEKLQKEQVEFVKRVVDEGEVLDVKRLAELKIGSKKLSLKRRALLAKGPTFETAFAVWEGSPQNVRVQLRGEPKNLGEEVPRRFLEILGGHTLPKDCQTSGRLELAEWIVDPQNPLTARVMVNRIWQHHFGKGLVASPNDFGIRGAAPTHPELLDFLAGHFIESGWSVKAMHRMIVLSRAYQMQSEGDPRNAEVDAANDFLWKFNRRRLSAEEIRDSILELSGELDLSSKSEPHPFPHWAKWGFTQHKPFQAVYESKRRSVYLMTQRFQRHPYIGVFDGPDNNIGTAARMTTTTPIQALFSMNSKIVHCAADGWARRLTALSDADHTRVEIAHREAFGRPIAPDERKRSQRYLLDTGSLTSYLRVLLATNEFLFVE